MISNSSYTESNHPLFPNMYFHLYNHANGEHNLYFSPKNYKHFLRRFDKYLYEYVHFHAFCLMPNHFHFLVEIKSTKEILAKAKIDYPHGLNHKEHKSLLEIQRFLDLDDFEAAAIVSERFRLFFMSYAKGINKQEEREGSLFRKYMRRRPILTDAYFKGCTAYIHRNPKHHFGIEEWRQWEWSSFKRILLKEATHLCKERTLEIFGGLLGFISYHDNYDKYKDEEGNWEIEE